MALRIPPPILFLVRAVVLVALFTALTLTGPFQRWIEEPLIAFNARLSHWLLGLFGAKTHLSGNVLSGNLQSGPSFALEVVSGCTGLFVVLVLASALLAFPAPWTARLRGLLEGSALIFVLNQARITSLYVLGAHFPDLFEDLHLYVWQGIIILATSFYWYVWAHRAATPRPAPAA